MPRDRHYLFPRHPSEIHRLDVQHYALRDALGANHLAPVQDARWVLDVGSGSGQWGFELCEELRDAHVAGVDIVPAKAGGPARVHQIRGNVLHGLPFDDGAFDFVHQRLLVAAVPVAWWPGVVAELVRVARPGGWVELVEGRWGLDGGGPATQRLIGMVKDLSSSLGLDTTGAVYNSLDGYLRTAGLLNVRRRNIALPIGEWGGRVGSLMATDFRASFTRLSELLEARSLVTAAEAHELVTRAARECEERRVYQPCAVAFGRKPSLPMPR